MQTMEEQNTRLRDDLKAGIAEVRGEMKTATAELRGDIRSMQRNMLFGFLTLAGIIGGIHIS